VSSPFRGPSIWDKPADDYSTVIYNMKTCHGYRVPTRNFDAMKPGVAVQLEQVAQPGLFDRRVASADAKLLVDGSSVGLQGVDRDEEGGRDLGL